MFGLGPTELVVILVLALLVMGPKRIPELASSMGKAIRSFRRATKELREQIDIDDEVRRPFEDLRSALRDEPPPPNYSNILSPAVPTPSPQPAATMPPAPVATAEEGAEPPPPAPPAAPAEGPPR